MPVTFRVNRLKTTKNLFLHKHNPAIFVKYNLTILAGFFVLKKPADLKIHL